MLEKRIQTHDESKFSDTEFNLYAKRFFSPAAEVTQELKDEYGEKSWKHHYETNPHHHEHFYPLFDQPIELEYTTPDGVSLPLEDQCKLAYIEMFCDWLSFSFKDVQDSDTHNNAVDYDDIKSNETEFEYWYNRNKDNIKIHPEMQSWFDDALEQVMKAQHDYFIKNKNESELLEAELHDTLNPKLWSGTELKPEIRSALMKIAYDFIASVDLPLNVLDIRFLGSNASYNYTKHSDIDLHIITNFELLPLQTDLSQVIYNYVKNDYNNKHNITVKGQPVELYIEDVKSTNASNGVYSLSNNKWLKEPTKPDYEYLDISDVLSKEKEIIDGLLKSNDKDQVDFYLNNLYLNRKDFLANEGENSVGNLLFKALRDEGLIEKLRDKFFELSSEELSLESESTITIYRGIAADTLDDAYKYIKTKKTYNSQDFGSGPYWSTNVDIAKDYGNFLYKAQIHPSEAKKIVEGTQGIVILDPDFNYSVNKELVDYIPLGPGVRYSIGSTGYTKYWNNTRNITSKRQEQYKNWIKDNFEEWYNGQNF